MAYAPTLQQQGGIMAFSLDQALAEYFDNSGGGGAGYGGPVKAATSPATRQAAGEAGVPMAGTKSVPTVLSIFGTIMENMCM
jgi:hypothetical protein